MSCLAPNLTQHIISLARTYAPENSFRFYFNVTVSSGIFAITTMPGPKMGPRPPDFDDDLVRRSPTFRKWEELLPGATLRYACREFSKGSGDDEERLMRRIMIARRNNVRDHQALKWARRMQSTNDKKTPKAAGPSSSSSQQQQQQQPRKNPKGANASRVEIKRESENSGGYNSNHSRSETEANLLRTSRLLPGEQGHSNRSRFETEAIISRTSHLLPGEQGPSPGRRSRRPTTLISDEAIKEEMDVDAVESTRSYKQWSSLPNGAQFLYNQKYIKGHEAHDWLLKKNIWRRMRYRRENKKMVEQMLSLEKGQTPSVVQQQQSRKRRHDATAVSNSATGSTATTNRLDGIMVDAAAPTMVVSTTSTLTTEAAAAAAAALGMTTPNETNRQEMVASTASEIVDHALLSTNTGVGAAATPTLNAATGETITISIGDLHQQQQQQQLLQAHHHQHHSQHHNQHHNDAAESAAAFAASIAMAGVGMSIGTDGDLVNSNHETAVADSAAVEAAVAAALAATDVKSNAYHNHLSHSSVNHHHESLMDANIVVHHGSNDPLAATSTTTADGRGLHSHSVHPPSAEALSPLPTEASVAGLGLALDAAAKLAAAAATTSASDEAVLAVTEAITASAQAGSVGVGGDGDEDDEKEALII